MAYVREEILARVLVIAKDVQGIIAAERNVPDVSKLQRPAIAIRDGSEQRIIGPRTDKRSAVQMMEATVPCTIYVGAAARDQGTLANTYFARFMSAVLQDSALDQLAGTNGEIRYEAGGLEDPEAESREARMEVTLVFVYPFVASAL